MKKLKQYIWHNEWLHVAALFLGSVGLFSWQLGKESFWLDEIYTLRASDTWEHLVATLTWKEKNMWLYHSVMFFWQKLGQSEFSIRMLSLLFAAAGVVAMYFLGKKLASRKVGLCAAVLLALNTFFIAYAQEARSYSLLQVLFILSSYFFIDLLRGKKDTRTVVLYCLFTGLAFYAHVFAAIFIVVQLLFLAYFLVVKNQNWVLFLQIAAGIGAFLLPLVGFYVLANTHNSVSHAQAALNWIPRPTWHTLYQQYYLYSSESVTLFVLYIAAILYGLKRNREMVYLYSIAFGTVLAVFALSFVFSPLFIPRYVIFSLPAFVLLAATIVDKMANRKAMVVMLLLVVGLHLKSIGIYFSHYHKEQWRQVVAYIYSHKQKDELIVIDPEYLTLPYNFYATQTNSYMKKDVLLAFPNDLKNYSPETIRHVLQTLSLTIAGHSGIWVVYRTELLPVQRKKQKEELDKTLKRLYGAPEVLDYGQIKVDHYRLKNSPS